MEKKESEITKKSTKFSKENQPSKRRGKSIKTILEERVGKLFEVELTANDKLDVMDFLTELSKKQLEDLVKDEAQAILVKILASQLLHEKYGIIWLEKLTDRLLKREGMRENTNNEIIIKYGE
jgi:hypothetical protein